MTDIVERLRAPPAVGTHALMREAADEIEQLRALLSELIDIEGPQPGTNEWAHKVRRALEPKP